METHRNLLVFLVALVGINVSTAQGWSRVGHTIHYEIGEGWAGKKVDIFFALDSSSSIWINDFYTMSTFVADMVKEMDIGANKTRVGLGVFSYRHRVVIPLDNTMTKGDLMDAIKDAKYTRGDCYISKAIQGIRREGLAPHVIRKGVPHIAVLFTDGRSTYQQLTLDNSTQAKQEGIHIYTVGIGRNVDKQELRTLSSDPKDDFAFLAPSFRSMDTTKGVTPALKEHLMTSMVKVEVPQGDEGTCGQKDEADVVFVYDEYSVGQTNSAIVKDFIKSLVEDFRIDSRAIRVGVYSKTCHTDNVNLGRFLNQKDFLDKMDKAETPGLSSLLKTVRQSGFSTENGGRSHARKRIVLILHGNVADARDLVSEARRANYAGFEIFMLKINSELFKGALGLMGTTDTTIDMNSIDELSHKKNAFLQSFCRELN